MTDRLDFETRLEERLRARAALASRPFDAAGIARQAVAVSGRRRSLGSLRWPATHPALGWFVALLLAIALLGAVAGIGALLAERPGLPVSNGWIAVSANPKDVGGGEVGDIYLVAEGVPARRIIGSDADGVAEACPRFSPDGRRLAYGEARASEPVTTFRGVWPVADRAVVVVALDDQGNASPPIVRVVLPADPGEIPCPEWSPDGRYVAFRIDGELRVANAATGQTTTFPVLEAPWGQQGFEWSRDGSLIAVSESGQIHVVPVDGGDSNLIPVEGATPRSLGWTADERIVYVTTDEPGDGLAGHVVDADGNNDIQLTPIAADLTVSPDGTRLARVAGPELSRVVTMDTYGLNVVEILIPSKFGGSALQWSPDGGRVLLSSIAGVVSVALVPGSPAAVHSQEGELNLEWSGSEVTWQPVFP